MNDFTPIASIPEELGHREKHYLDIDVYTATLQRLNTMFDEFPNYFISFSGGKDSTVALHLTLQEARRRNRLPVKVLFIDLEAQYDATIHHIEEISLATPMSKSTGSACLSRFAMPYLSINLNGSAGTRTAATYGFDQCRLILASSMNTTCLQDGAIGSTRAWSSRSSSENSVCGFVTAAMERSRLPSSPSEPTNHFIATLPLRR